MAAAEGEVRTDLRDDGVLVVTIDHPPANALTPALRGALIVALDAARATGVRGVVLRGAGRNFSAATAVDLPPGPPSLADLCACVEDLPVPVVAALHGAAVGPGAELALAAHARIAQEGARFLLPEAGLGLLPEGGATQRLPRLVGVAEALILLLRARSPDVGEGLAIGLYDRIVEGDATEAAVAMALAMPGPRPSRDRTASQGDFAASLAAVTAARETAARGVLPAPSRIVDCVEAALMLPFENGMAMEAVAREDLEAGEEAAGLCAVALAERRAAMLPAEVARVRPKAAALLGLAGGGPQLAPLALVALGHGLQVRWADGEAGGRTAGLAWVSARLAEEVRAGRLSAVQRDADRARLAAVAGLQDLAGCDLVVLGAAGGGPLRQEPGVPHLLIGGAEGQLGLSLAPSARLSELALPPEHAAPEEVAVAVQALRRLGLPPVLVGKMPILGRRVGAAGRAALAGLLASGVPRRVLAAALDGFGHPMPDLPDPAEPAPMRAMTEAEVLHRWLGAMANEGLAMLDARVARRPSDIDLVLVAGHGFPRWRGGPMHQAGRRGLMVLRRDLRAFAADAPEIWAPHPLLDRMIAEGRRLADLDDPARAAAPS